MHYARSALKKLHRFAFSKVTKITPQIQKIAPWIYTHNIESVGLGKLHSDRQTDCFEGASIAVDYFIVSFFLIF